MLLSRTLATLFILSVMRQTVISAEPAEKSFYPPDAPDLPQYTLPDPLTTTHAKKIPNADEWKSYRRGGQQGRRSRVGQCVCPKGNKNRLI